MQYSEQAKYYITFNEVIVSRMTILTDGDKFQRKMNFPYHEDFSCCQGVVIDASVGIKIYANHHVLAYIAY